MIWKLLILFSLTGTTVCLMCYQCSDTTDDERKNQCQTYIRTMSKKQGDWLKDGKLRPYIKNCSDFGDLEEEDIYCHIVSLRRGVAQNIDCGYRLGQPRRGVSNKYPEISVLDKKKKKKQLYTHPHPSFTSKVGFKGYTFHGHVFLGPVVQNFVSLTTSLRPQLVILSSTTTKKGTGALLTYIRDCSNGHHFFGADFNSLFTTGNVLPDNQTTCMYSPQGYLACVTLCGPNEDFCNGPKADANSNTVSMIMIVTILVGALWKCHC